MATAQVSDSSICPLCSVSVDFHCVLCCTDLCENCVLSHLKDKTNKHQVVDIRSKHESIVLPICSSHAKTCEIFCFECEAPVCTKCLTTSHSEHNFKDLETLVESFRQAIASKMEEKKFILKKCQTFKDTLISEEIEFDKILSEISQREENMIESVHQAAEKLRSDVLKQKTERIAENIKHASKITNAEQQLQNAIKKNEELLLSKNAKDFIYYDKMKDNFKDDALFQGNCIPRFVAGGFLDDHITKILGSLSFEDITKCKAMDSTIENSLVLTTFQSPHDKINRIQCIDKDKIWIGGKCRHVYKMDRTGIVLNILESPKTFFNFSESYECSALTISASGNVFFSHESTVYLFDNTAVKLFLFVNNWMIQGLCLDRNGDLIASMRSKGMQQSKVAKFSGDSEVQRIQSDKQGRRFFSAEKTLFSSSKYNGDALSLTTNTDGDIFVADCRGEAV
ncbi:E3 ubiquitin-protein ligase TRIM33-like, partial [Saccostrea cucullata]|uniref:E3 ubiquitin-protein ligase TRIM33-like n=1 Tax=Saccostrea cuccullata TaxID=36930 RepID=UPI002ED1CB27